MDTSDSWQIVHQQQHTSKKEGAVADRGVASADIDEVRQEEAMGLNACSSAYATAHFAAVQSSRHFLTSLCAWQAVWSYR